jgi:CHASE3 domain sensor protein
MVEAFMEFTLGQQSYRSGAFTDAKIHLQTADNDINALLVAWNEQGTAFENAMLEYYQALANATKKQADAVIIQANAALNTSYGWIFFGLGWTLIGIGIIIYGAKKPKAATT